MKGSRRLLVWSAMLGLVLASLVLCVTLYMSDARSGNFWIMPTALLSFSAMLGLIYLTVRWLFPNRRQFW